MITKAAALFALLLLAALAGARTPQAPAGQKPEPAGKEELEEAARLDADVVNLFGRGRYDEAAPLAERVLEIRLKAYGPTHPGVADAQYNVGMIRVGQGRFAEAEGVLRQALATYEKAAAASDPARAKVLSGLALASSKQGRGDEALKLSGAALAAAEKAFGVEGKEVADYCRQLADLYRLKGERGKAEEFYLRAIRLWAKTAGREDARVGMTVESLMCMGGGNPQKVGRRINEALGSDIRSGASVLNGRAVSLPPPRYPYAAQAARLEGAVVMKVLVDESGAVTRLDAVCGPSILAEASVEAARGARFMPTLLDGKPVKVSGFIIYNFVRR